MKQLYNLILFLTFTITGFTQSIAPSINDEFCPEAEITFSVTIPGAFQNIIAIGNSSVTVSPYNLNSSSSVSTFNFKGKFGDVNQAQKFKVEYNTSAGATSHEFIFRKVKSLFYTISCSQIQPNQTVLTAPSCQVTNIAISFPNVQWGNPFESPQLCYGSISTYEYQLPVGWQLNGFTSNGSNWIAGDNNETVTTNLLGGNGAQIN